MTTPPQMPAAPDPGPAPVPYGGPDLSPEPPLYGPADMPVGTMGPDVMAGTGSAMGVVESPAAHDIAAGVIAPYYPGEASPILVHGDADAGGRDDVAGTVAGAVAAAEARFTEHMSDTYGQGSTIGDVMTLPPSPLDPGVGSLGTTDPSGGYYDPPRSY